MTISLQESTYFRRQLRLIEQQQLDTNTLKPFDKNIFLETVFGSLEGISLEAKEETEAQQVTEETETKEEEIEEETEEPQEEPKIKELTSDDPFEGIDTDDIEKYSDWYDVPPPENDQEAIQLANKIKKC